MKCPNCGKTIGIEVLKCPACGHTNPLAQKHNENIKALNDKMNETINGYKDQINNLTDSSVYGIL